MRIKVVICNVLGIFKFGRWYLWGWQRCAEICKSGERLRRCLCHMWICLVL